MKLRSYTKQEVENLIGAIIAEVLDENHDEMLKILDSIPKEFRAQIVNTNGVCGETPGHIAIYKDDQYMLRILLDYGAHPHAQNLTKSGDTLLHTATKLGKLSFLKMLYETHLCDMQIRNKEGMTLLDASRLIFDPFKDLFALRLFKNYTAYHEQEDDILLSREEYEQHLRELASSYSQIHGLPDEDDCNSSISFYDDGQLKYEGGTSMKEGFNPQFSEIKEDGSLRSLKSSSRHDEQPMCSPRFEIDHKSVHGIDLDHMDNESIGNGSIETGTSRSDEMKTPYNDSQEGKSNRSVLSSSQMIPSYFLNDNSQDESKISRRTNDSSVKSRAGASSRMSQEELEQVSIVDGRKLCEEYILNRIDYDEFMRVEKLKKETNEWMRGRERNRRILAGMDHYHNTHVTSRMTYPQVEGRDVVTLDNQDWYDKFRFGVQLVSRSIFADNVVANAIKLGSMKAEHKTG